MASDVVLSQDGRWLTMDSPLGTDVLIPTSLTGEERLSTLFEFTVEALSQELDIDPGKLLGQPVTVSHFDRAFHGIVRSLSGGPMASRGYRMYRLTLVPTVWLLTKTTDCRIFQDQSALDIVETVLSEGGVTDLDTSGVSNTPETRDYCVQYNETDFAFVSRLLEEEGIFYTFRHEDGKHTMVLGDATSAYQPCDEDEVVYRPGGGISDMAVSSWERDTRFRMGTFVHDDYDFEAPSTDLTSDTATVLSPSAFSSWEHYEYPGRYTKTARGATLSRQRMEAEEAGYEVVSGAGRYKMFSPGQTFTITEHPVPAVTDSEHVLVSVAHEIVDESHFSGGGAQSYANHFTCIPAKVPFHPDRKTPKAVVRGPQTAMVVGPSGEDIHTDEYGRIRCQFHWDRLGASDEKSSCWIRVAQMWAGRQWGALFLPRIGMEVVVEFLEGDPDRPLVTGCVYNAEAMPPYELPTNKTQSGIKTRSTTDGGTADFNELRFEDKKDSEEVYFHAQKDFTRFVENDDTLTVDHDQTETVKNDRTRTVTEGNESVTISEGNQTITISEGNQEVTVAKGNQDVTVSKGNQTVTVASGDQDVTVKGNQSLTVSQGDQTIDISKGDQSVTLGQGSQTVTLKKGDLTAKCSKGSITLDAKNGIELKVGSNSIKISTSGITIKGSSVTVQATGSAKVKGATTTVEGTGTVTVKSSGSAKLQGTIATVSGDAVAKVNGAIAMIN